MRCRDGYWKAIYLLVLRGDPPALATGSIQRANTVSRGTGDWLYVDAINDATVHREVEMFVRYYAWRWRSC